MEDTVETEFVSLLVLVNISPASAAVGLERFQYHLITTWSQPLNIKFRIDMGLVNELTGRIEFPGDKKLLLAWLSRDCSFIFCRHFIFSPFFEYPLKLHPDDRTVHSNNVRRASTSRKWV